MSVSQIQQIQALPPSQLSPSSTRSDQLDYFSMASSSEVLAVDLEQTVFTNRDETVAGQLLVKGQPSSIKRIVVALVGATVDCAASGSVSPRKLPKVAEFLRTETVVWEPVNGTRFPPSHIDFSIDFPRGQRHPLPPSATQSLLNYHRKVQYSVEAFAVVGKGASVLPAKTSSHFVLKKVEELLTLPTMPDLTQGPPSFADTKSWRTNAVTDLTFVKHLRTFAKASVALVLPATPKLPCLVSVPISVVVSVRSKSFSSKPAEPPTLPDVDEGAIKLGLFASHMAYQSGKYQFASEPAERVLDLWAGEAVPHGRQVWHSDMMWQQTGTKGDSGSFEKIVVWSLAFEPDLDPSFDAVHGKLSVRPAGNRFLFVTYAIKLSVPFTKSSQKARITAPCAFSTGASPTPDILSRVNSRKVGSPPLASSKQLP